MEKEIVKLKCIRSDWDIDFTVGVIYSATYDSITSVFFREDTYEVVDNQGFTRHLVLKGNLFDFEIVEVSYED